MQKNSITNKITPCCGLPFSVIYWWVSNLTLNSEADRQFIISKISQGGIISVDAWKILINSGTLEADASLTKAEFLAWFDCGRQPSCTQLKLIIEGFKIGNWTPETELPLNIATVDEVTNGQTLIGNTYTKDQTDDKINDAKLSGIVGKATQANAPTPYDAVTYPNGLFETYVVRTPLTMPNSWGIAVTQSELDANFVYFDVTNGVVSKFSTLKPQPYLDNKEYFLPSCYGHSYFADANGIFISVKILKDITKYGQLYLQFFHVVGGNFFLGFCNEAETLVLFRNDTAFSGLGTIQLFDVTDGYRLEPIIELVVDSSKLGDTLLNHGKLLPLNFQPTRLKSASEYFKPYQKNLGKLASLLGGVQIQHLSTVGMTVKNAEDFGISPSNTATANSTAINAAIAGGNVLLKLNETGAYLLGNPIEIENNTVIWQEIGAYFKKTINDYAFVNKGARTRTQNSNIQFHNFELDSNHTTSIISGQNNPALPTFGLRGSVSMFGITNLKLTGKFKIYNDADIGFQMANWYDVEIENYFVDCVGDGFHINDGHKLRGKNFEIHSGDDGIPLNAFDWINSSPSVGDIYDIVIENYKDYKDSVSVKKGQTMRTLVGAGIPYYANMLVMIGDMVSNGGYRYRVLDNLGSGEKTSGTAPTLTADGLQSDTGGFQWKFAGVDTGKLKTDIHDVLINGLQSLTDDRHILRFDSDRADVMTYGRGIHPDVTDFPSVLNVNLMNVYKPTDGKLIYAADNMDDIKFLFRVIGLSGLKARIFESDATAEGTVELYDADLTANQIFASSGVGSTIVALNCVGTLQNDDAPILGKLITDANVFELPAAKVEDSICYYNNEAYIVYRGNWEKI